MLPTDLSTEPKPLSPANIHFYFKIFLNIVAPEQQRHSRSYFLKKIIFYFWTTIPRIDRRVDSLDAQLTNALESPLRAVIEADRYP